MGLEAQHQLSPEGPPVAGGSLRSLSSRGRSWPPQELHGEDGVGFPRQGWGMLRVESYKSFPNSFKEGE